MLDLEFESLKQVSNKMSRQHPSENHTAKFENNSNNAKKDESFAKIADQSIDSSIPNMRKAPTFSFAVEEKQEIPVIRQLSPIKQEKSNEQLSPEISQIKRKNDSKSKLEFRGSIIENGELFNFLENQYSEQKKIQREKQPVNELKLEDKKEKKSSFQIL